MLQRKQEKEQRNKRGQRQQKHKEEQTNKRGERQKKQEGKQKMQVEALVEEPEEFSQMSDLKPT